MIRLDSTCAHDTLVNLVVNELIDSYETLDGTHFPLDDSDKKYRKAIRRVIKYYTTDQDRLDLGLDF